MSDGTKMAEENARLRGLLAEVEGWLNWLDANPGDCSGPFGCIRERHRAFIARIKEVGPTLKDEPDDDYNWLR